MRRPIKLPEPADQLDPEIRAAMVTSEISVPAHDHFKGYISEADIADLQNRDRKTILAMSVHGQWIDWTVETVLEMYGFIRQLDAEVARRKIEIAKLKAQTQETTIVWNSLKWIGLTIGAGALSALGQWMIKN